MLASANATTLYGYRYGVEFVMDYRTDYFAEVTLNNTSSKTITIYHSSNYAPYKAGGSTQSGGNITVPPSVNTIFGFYVWGTPGDMSLNVDNEELHLSGTRGHLPGPDPQNPPPIIGGNPGVECPDIPSVPEPSSVMVLALGALALVGRRVR